LPEASPFMMVPLPFRHGANESSVSWVSRREVKVGALVHIFELQQRSLV
jgi:hypothetical protein